MPIKPENRSRYPKNWKEIRAAILERANNRCEFCGVENHTVRLNPKTGKEVKIVLTIAHLDHTPENCDPDNLRALCQRCHNQYDAQHRAETRKAKKDMIDIKELRIGAHICVDGNRVAVNKITDSGLVVYIKDNGYVDARILNTVSVKPIPLSYELLRDIGFKPYESLYEPDSEWIIDLDGYPITVMKGMSNHINRDWSVHIDNWDYDTIGSASVAYLHQLESIIYLVTGKELIKD